MYNFNRTLPTFLKSDCSTNALYCLLDSLLDTNGNQIVLDTGEYFDVTFEKDGVYETNVINRLVYRPNGNVEAYFLTPNGRNIAPQKPFGGNATGKDLFIASTIVKVSNSPDIYGKYLLNIASDQTITGKKTFNQSPSIPPAVNPSDPATLAQLNSVIIGAVPPATETTAGLVTNATRDEYIGGQDLETPDGGIFNITSTDNQKDMYYVDAEEIFFLGIDNNLYFSNTINNISSLESAITTGTQTLNFQKILYVADSENIWLITTNNQIYKWNGNAFILIVLTGQILPAGICLRAINNGSGLVYMTFVGSKKIYTFNTSTNIMAILNATDLDFYAYDISLDITNNLLYILQFNLATLPTIFGTFSVANMIAGTLGYRVGRYNLSTNVYQAGTNWVDATFGSAFFLIVSSSTFNSMIYKDGKLFFTGLNSASGTPVASQGVFSFTIVNNPDGTFVKGTRQIYSLGVGYSPLNPLALTTYNNTLNTAFFVNDTLYFLRYPTTTNEFQTFFVNTFSAIPLSTRPSVARIITANTGNLNLKINKGNFYDISTSTQRTWIDTNLTIIPPITGTRTDLVVIGSNNVPTLRAGNGTQKGNPINGDIILGTVFIDSESDSIDYTDIINNENLTLYSSENNISFIAGESISKSDAISIQNINTNGVLIQKLIASASSSSDINNTTTTLTNFNLPTNTNSVLLVFSGETNPFQGTWIFPSAFIVNGVSQTANKIADWSYGFSGNNNGGTNFGSQRTVIFKIDITPAQLNGLNISYSLSNFQARGYYNYHIALQNLNVITATSLSAPVNGSPNSASITEASTNNYYILFNNGLNVSVNGVAQQPTDYINIGNLSVGSTPLSWNNPAQQPSSTINTPIGFGYLKFTASGTITTQVIVKSNSSVVNRQNFIGFASSNANINDTTLVNILGLETDLTNLSAGSSYYTSPTNGVVSTTNASGSVLVGKALSNNTLKLT